MSFWEKNSLDDPIEQLLNKGGTLRELLALDEIHTSLMHDSSVELKSFITIPENLKQLVLYTIQKDDTLDETNQLRYPYYCCEILKVLIGSVLDKGELLELEKDLFSMLDFPPPLNQPYAAYFKDLAWKLLQNHTQQVVQLLISKENFLQQILVHMGSTSISEFFLLFLEANSPEPVEWALNNNLLEELVTTFEASEDQQIKENISELLVSLISQPNDEQNQSVYDEALQKYLPRILESTFGEQGNKNIRYTIPILEALVPKTEPSDDHPLLSQLSDFFPQINQTLKLNTTGNKDSLGMNRFLVLRFLQALFSNQKISLLKKAAQDQLFSTLIDLLFQYRWNNLAHCCIEGVVKSIFSSQSIDLIYTFTESTNLHHRIGEASQNKEENGELLGHLAEIGKLLNSAADSDKNLQELLDSDDGWVKYATELQEAQSQDSKPLGDSCLFSKQERFEESLKHDFESPFPVQLEFSLPIPDLTPDIGGMNYDERIFSFISTNEEGFGKEVMVDGNGSD